MSLTVPVLVGMRLADAEIFADVEEGSGDFRIVGSYALKKESIPAHVSKELQVRVFSALTRMGKYIKGQVRITVPHGIRFCELDLAIALECLEAIGVCALPKGLYARAELGLDGSLRPVPGCFTALSQFRGLASPAVVAREDVREAAAANVEFRPMANLADVASLFPVRLPEPWEPMATRAEFHTMKYEGDAPDRLKSAAEEGRSVLLVGRPVSGRMILARYYHSFLTLTTEQAIEVMQVQSVGCVLDYERFRVPFRAPHHSVSLAGMIGQNHRPGEVSLAHHGILVLDEVLEFRRDVIEAVKSVQRGKRAASFPADFRIVATAPACPKDCPKGNCTCSGALRERHEERLASLGLEVIRLP